jgi:hypothetical protein
MKRLVIAGLPCPADAWLDFLDEDTSDSDTTRVISMGEVFAKTESSDPRELASYVQDEIAQFRPDSIVCHGIGVPLTLLGMWRLRRHEGAKYNPCITIFNGAFRKVSLLQAREPLWIQLLPAGRLAKHAEMAGGKVDLHLKQQMYKIRALYRTIILHRATEKISQVLGLDSFARIPRGERYRLDVQVIASSNDPFLPLDSMEKLASDLKAKRFVVTEYGHFPYSGDEATILPAIHSFEKAQAC